jgi:hypothetical protein
LAAEAQRLLAIRLPRPAAHAGDSPIGSGQAHRHLTDWYSSGAFSWGAAPLDRPSDTAPWLDTRWSGALTTLAEIRSGWPADLSECPSAVRQLWSHGLTVGLTTELIARLCDAGDASEAFLAGALHDIGLLALQRLLPESFVDLLEDVDPLTSTWRSERRRWGWDHQQLGAELLRLWRLPEAVRDAARYHHLPLQMPINRPHARLVWCVAMANYLCSRAGRSSLGVHNVPPPPDDVFAQLSIDAGMLRMIWSSLPERLELASHLSSSR